MEDSASGSLYRKPRDMNVIGGGLLNESDYYDYTDYETVDLREETPSEAVWIPLVYSVVVIVGLLGNGLLLLVLIRRRRFWRPSDTFVLQLGVVDILLLVTLIIWAIRANQKCVHCSVTLFKICRAVWNINFYVGMFLLVCICLENLLVKVRSGWFSQHGAGFSVTCYSLTWLLSVILAVLDWCLFPSNSSKEMPIYVHEHSGVGFDKLLALRLIHLLIGFLVPLLILIIWCAHTFLQRRQNKTSAILALVTVFLVCWIPYNITLILDTIYYGSSHFLKKVPIDPEASLKTALTVTSAMGSVHACLRPLLYFLFRPNFRKSVLSVLRCSSPQRMTSLWELGVSQNDEEHSEERQKQMEMLQQRQEAA